MIRLDALALPLAIFVLLSGPAPAQTQNCGGALVVDSVSYGTQRVPRDPRNPGSSEWLTLSVGVRNVSPAAVTYTASFPSPAVQQDFLAGQSWTLAAGARSTLVVANVLRPPQAEATVAQLMRFTCR